VAAKQKRKRKLLLPFILLLLFSIAGVQLLRLQEKIETAEAEKAALEQQLSEQQQENDALSSALDKANDTEYLEELARDQLGYVTPGEKDFYDVSN